MIHEVDEGLRLLMVEAGLQESGVELVFDAPTKDWAARRNAPTISVFLHGIREDTDRRRTGTAEEYDDRGIVIGRRTQPRWFELTYLVTAWTNRPQDEHRLLSEVLRCLVRSDVLPVRMRTGSLAELGLTVEIEAAGRSADGPSASDLWSALGGELKAGIDLRVWAPLAGERTPVGPPVTEGLVVRAAPAPGGDGAAPGRRLRYHGASDPEASDLGASDPGASDPGASDSGVSDPSASDLGGHGFAPERERRSPPGRRRRGGGGTAR
ncbi:DUF4255 domain-containing protein [Streptomyces jumonjinensis]|uniref:DUF4255 domain-containing protein n=1 Tax=Streptomyces jumonjinensis TaxID=1945 RepID=A0A646KSK5_STRJU|nr:DUF4255 domain-containing protein [Streptomyces jumonjinensis]MQT05309.1 DUF4255 domain-containing protein [Streptomyces jumonjinensis]